MKQLIKTNTGVPFEIDVLPKFLKSCVVNVDKMDCVVLVNILTVYLTCGIKLQVE